YCASAAACQPGSSVVGCRNREEQDNKQSGPDGADVAEDQPCARQAVALLAGRTDLPSCLVTQDDGSNPGGESAEKLADAAYERGDGHAVGVLLSLRALAAVRTGGGRVRLQADVLAGQVRSEPVEIGGGDRGRPRGRPLVPFRLGQTAFGEGVIEDGLHSRAVAVRCSHGSDVATGCHLRVLRPSK